MTAAKSTRIKYQEMARGTLAILLVCGLVLSVSLVYPSSSFASLPINEPYVVYSIDFSDFTGSGFAPEPATGQLDSDYWRISGMSDGDLDFGETMLSGDYTKGQSTGDVGPSGIYAFQVDTGVVTLGVKPSNADFTPGEFVLRIQNNTSDQITDLQIGYDLWVNNNEKHSTIWGFHHSADDVTYQQVAAGDYTSGQAADDLGWQMNSFTIDLAGLAIDHGSYYYMKWSSVDGAGNGQRDEFGLNNITISATVSAVNYPPDAVDDSESTPEDTPITIDVLANDTDLDEDVLLLDSFSQPTNGIVTRQENGTPLDTSDDSLTYTPDQDWSDEDTFTYSIDDGNGETDTATATITVTAVNDPPDAVDDNANTPEDTAVPVDVLLNDTDPELDTIYLDSFTQGSNGSVARDDNGTVEDTSDDQLVYTPAAGWSGEDSFTHTISDGNGGVDSATVTVTVEPANEPPDAMDDSETTQENSPVTIDVMFNDSDPDSDPLYLDSFTQPSNGTVERDDNGTTGDTSDDKLVYTPAGDWSGEDSFTYTISDGNGGEATANVTVTVEALYPYTIYFPLIMR